MRLPRIWILIIVVLGIILATTSAFSPAGSQKSGDEPIPAPLNPDFLNPPLVHFGYRPASVDTSHISAPFQVTVGALPSAWDWRIYGGVTPVQNQGNCGSCWAFAAMGGFESLVLIKSGKAFDFSEENLKECNYWGYGCAGGNAFVAANHLTTAGTTEEACDPYHAYDTNNCNTVCPKIKQATGWKVLPNDINSIKNAIYYVGPVYTSMYASFPGFSGYNGTSVLYYTGSESPNHAVVIVGWDDARVHPGGSGAWICKNSWGTSWGENGYFYIAFGSARIGTNSSYFDTYKHFDYLEMTDTLYHYDEAGWYNSYGFSGQDTAYGLVKFTPAKDDCVTAVDFWATDDDATYTIEIYDDFDGTTLSNKLFGPKDVYCALPGYYSANLDSSVWVKKENAFYVVVKGKCTNYYYPIAVDGFAPVETNKTYISLNPAGPWYEMGSRGFDIAVRARSKNHQPVFAKHDFTGDGFSDIAVWRPSEGNWYVRNGSVENWGTEGDIPVNGDYDGNGITDRAVWRPSNGYWFIRYAGGGTQIVQWGAPGDIPVPGDYDADGKTETAVWRPSNGCWFIRYAGGGTQIVQWGTAGDIPVPGDYDNDLKTDIAVWRPSDGYWFIRYAGGGIQIVQWGTIGDIPVPGDYDADKKCDPAVWRPTEGTWYFRYSKGGQASFQWGTYGDVPTPGAFKSIGISDIAVWRPSNGCWFIMGLGVYQWGAQGDIPLVR